jgi:hypothetical protein
MKYIVKFKYKLQYAPTTGPDYSEVDAESAAEAGSLVLQNPKVEKLLAIFIVDEILILK